MDTQARASRIEERMQTTAPPADHEIRRLLEGRLHNPGAVLGCHWLADGCRVRAHLPGAMEAKLVEANAMMERVGDSDVFQWHGRDPGAKHYRIEWRESGGAVHTEVDPYSFSPQLDIDELHAFNNGHHDRIYRVLGAHSCTVDSVAGCRFAVWAPNAERVSVVGDFNRWDGRRHPMQAREATGVWEIFIPGVQAGACYKFEIRNRDSGRVLLKADPYARQAELRPSTASVISGPANYQWRDEQWLQRREQADWLHQPMSIYEVHLGSWRRDGDGGFLNYRELAERLVPYVKELGFTHIELLPVSEHPFDGSWGYQSTGYYAPTARFGSANDFRYFVDYCHSHDIGVILDWVAGHFPKDDHALARFDGSEVYEHADIRLAEQPDWGTLSFNFGRHEVKNFLVANALYWIDEFHIDGLRVDAVASMLYLDYSRQPGEWVPNQYGGNENLEAIAFLRDLNEKVHHLHPGALVIAEESTAWPQVSRPTYVGGLGFSMKWDMGWMHDTLSYLANDPIHRRYHHGELTFGMLYHYQENFVLPLSHDEVVHGKGSLVNKMPGDNWQQFANLRLLLSYMFTYPGKKLLFMGGEFGQRSEWNFDSQLDWWVLQFTEHKGMQALVGRLNQLYCQLPALYRHEFNPEGFNWIDCQDSEQSILSYLRRNGEDVAVVVLNFTPVPRHGYRLGVPVPGFYRELLNSDSEWYGGSNVGNIGGCQSEALPWMNQPHSIELTLPPLGALVLVPDQATGDET